MLQHSRTKYSGCPLCESTAFQPVRTASVAGHPRYKPELPAELIWMACTACGHEFAEGYFDDAALALIFSESNAGQQVGEGYEQARWIAARMVQRVARHVGEGRWLDVGFGNAALVFTADEFGYEAVGLDLREQEVATLRRLGFEAHCRLMEDFETSEPFDVLSLADVLEHMPFPNTGLTAARRLLRRGGALLVSMPNADAFVWREMAANPYHGEIEYYHNFGRRRLYDLLRETGFEPCEYGVSERYRACMEVIARRT